jgi:hypothetical protein
VTSPRPDQQYRPPAPSTVSPGGTRVFRQVIIIGSGGLLLVYSPTAGSGNLIASIAATSGTDAYGNYYLPGVTSYSPGTPFGAAVSLNNGQVSFFTAGANLPGPWTDQTVGLTIAQVSAGVWAPQLVSASNLLDVGGSPFAVTLPWAGLDAAGTGPDTFHTFSFVNSWAQTAGRLTTGYTMNALGDVFVEGSVTVPAGFAAGQNITAAGPVYYRPVSIQSLTAWDITTNLPVRLAYSLFGALLFEGPVGNTASGHTLDIPKQIIDVNN